MREAYQVVSKNSQQSSARGKKYCDHHLKGVVLQPGDRVLVCNLGDRGGPGMLKSCGKQTVYVVQEQVDDNPLYKVSPENGGNRVMTLHRNLLHVVSDLPADPPPWTKTI